MNARAALLVGGFAVDQLLGDPQRFHPVAGFGKIAGSLEQRIWADDRRAGGVYALTLVGGTAVATGAGCVALSGRPWARASFELAVLWSALAGRSLQRVAHAMSDELAADDIVAARRLAPSLVGRDPSALEEDELARATIESVAENTGDGVIAPLFWFAVGGAPAVAAYRAANTLDSIAGHRSERYLRFGWAPARLDDLLNYVPARLGAAAVVVAASWHAGAALRVARAHGRRHPSPNAGLYEAAFAGALGLRLGGVNRYGDVLERRPELGDGAQPRVSDIRRATRLSGATSLLFVVALALSLERRT
ncbi:MAG: adenosylcobinamide-phosphate synthase CbiB [Gaiellaceae bacterium]